MITFFFFIMCTKWLIYIFGSSNELCFQGHILSLLASLSSHWQSYEASWLCSSWWHRRLSKIWLTTIARSDKQNSRGQKNALTPYNRGAKICRDWSVQKGGQHQLIKIALVQGTPRGFPELDYNGQNVFQEVFHIGQVESDQSQTQLKRHSHFQLSDFYLPEPVNP